jgi:hypothetical protein
VKYKSVIAYNPGTSVLFWLEGGGFALVSIDSPESKYLITVSGYAESFLKFGGFITPEGIPQNELEKASEILERGERIYFSNDYKFLITKGTEP